MTVVKASRSIFLALNKNARPVTTSRNILLDDYDLIAHFERDVLDAVKQQDATSPSALRLWNFELDAEENKTALTSTVAFSGVMHLHFLLERALFLSTTPNGLNLSSQRFGNIKFLNDLYRRLDGVNLLGQDVADNTTRHAFTSEALALLTSSFKQRYGGYILAGLQRFAPYESMSQAALDLEVELLNAHEMHCHSMLFEGQGHLRVFETYIEQLDSDLSERFSGKIPPELQSILDDFNATKGRLEQYQQQFGVKRAKKLLSAINPTKVVNVIVGAVNTLYRTVFTTQAFQTAFFMTFFSAIEKYNGDPARLTGAEDERQLFDEYLQSLNAFFKPANEASTKRLLLTFSGAVTGTFGTEGMKIAESEYTLRKIVIQRELKPEEWTKFRYILLELWKSQNKKLQDIIDMDVAQCRLDVVGSLYRRDLDRYCKEKGIDPTAVKPPRKEKLSQKVLEHYAEALAVLHDSEIAEAEQTRWRECLATLITPTVEDEPEMDESVVPDENPVP